MYRKFSIYANCNASIARSAHQWYFFAWKADFAPDVSEQEGKLPGKPILLLMCEIRKTGMFHRGPCGAGWDFPNLTDEEENARERAILLPMCQMGKMFGCDGDNAISNPGTSQRTREDGQGRFPSWSRGLC